MPAHLGHLELMVLLTVMQLDDAAYGVTVARTIAETTGRNVAIATIYLVLDRLEARGLVASRIGESTPERGGRAKRYFRITRKGVGEVSYVRSTLNQLWRGLPQLSQLKGRAT